MAEQSNQSKKTWPEEMAALANLPTIDPNSIEVICIPKISKGTPHILYIKGQATEGQEEAVIKLYVQDGDSQQVSFHPEGKTWNRIKELNLDHPPFTVREIETLTWIQRKLAASQVDGYIQAEIHEPPIATALQHAVQELGRQCVEEKNISPENPGFPNNTLEKQAFNQAVKTKHQQIQQASEPNIQFVLQTTTNGTALLAYDANADERIYIRFDTQQDGTITPVRVASPDQGSIQNDPQALQKAVKSLAKESGGQNQKYNLSKLDKSHHELAANALKQANGPIREFIADKLTSIRPKPKNQTSHIMLSEKAEANNVSHDPTPEPQQNQPENSDAPAATRTRTPTSNGNSMVFKNTAATIGIGTIAIWGVSKVINIGSGIVDRIQQGLKRIFNGLPDQPVAKMQARQPQANMGATR